MTEQLSRQAYSKHCQPFKMERLQKKKNNTWAEARNQKIFRAEGGLVELWHFNKHFVKNTRKKDSQGNILEFFLVDATKTIFWMENVTQGWTQSGRFFPKSGHFFWLSKQGGGGLPPPPSSAPVSVAENVSVSPNIPKCPENAWINCSDYARTLYMPDQRTCLTGF